MGTGFQCSPNKMWHFSLSKHSFLPDLYKQIKEFKNFLVMKNARILGPGRYNHIASNASYFFSIPRHCVAAALFLTNT